MQDLRMTGEATCYNGGSVYSTIDFSANDLTAGEIETETSVAGTNITLIADSSNKITVDANTATLSEISYTQRLKLNGTGATNKRCLKITNVRTGTYTIDFAHGSSSGDDRTLFVTTDGNTEIASLTVSASGKVSKTFTLSSDADVIYIYSTNSSINIYGIHE